MGTYAEGSYFFYAPNKVLPIVFGILVLISGLWHIYQNQKYGYWRATFLLPWAAAVFFAGFAMREWGAYEYDNLPVFISTTVLILAAPPVYAAAEYVILGRLLYYIPWLSPIHPGRVVSTFIGLGAVTEALTANGAAYFANSDNTIEQRKTGLNIIRSALLLQALIELGFFALVATFYARCRRANVVTPSIRTVTYLLFGTSLLILGRCIFRTVEVFENEIDQKPGSITTNEWSFWVFEVGMMIICTYWLNWHHPGQYLPNNFKLYLSYRDHKTEVEGPGWVDKRNFILTIFDPFDIVGLVQQNDKKCRFWEDESVPESMPESVPEGTSRAPDPKYDIYSSDAEAPQKMV
ncbi:MAG: hypothetical protein M1825_001852 [Sarcosagium campestre]|nr:MAG: hypothetical protein M1825_001852 [Sarcosagium campestre]